MALGECSRCWLDLAIQAGSHGGPSGSRFGSLPSVDSGRVGAGDAHIVGWALSQQLMTQGRLCQGIPPEDLLQVLRWIQRELKRRGVRVGWGSAVCLLWAHMWLLFCPSPLSEEVPTREVGEKERCRPDGRPHLSP